MSNYKLFRLKLWAKRTIVSTLPRKIAWLLPTPIVMWCYYRVLAHSTTGKYGKTIVPQITAMDAVDRYIKDFKL